MHGPQPAQHVELLAWLLGLGCQSPDQSFPRLGRLVPTPWPAILARGADAGHRLVVASRFHLTTDDPAGMGDGVHVDVDGAGTHGGG